MERDFILLQCPQCGGKLKPSDDPNVFGCVYCSHGVMLREPRPVAADPALASPSVSSPFELQMYEERRRRLEEELAKETQFQGCGTVFWITGVAMALAVFVIKDFGAVIPAIGVVGIVVGLPTLVWVKRNRKKSPRALALQEQIRALDLVIERHLGLR